MKFYLFNSKNKKSPLQWFLQSIRKLKFNTNSSNEFLYLILKNKNEKIHLNYSCYTPSFDELVHQNYEIVAIKYLKITICTNHSRIVKVIQIKFTYKIVIIKSKLIASILFVFFLIEMTA